MWIQKQKLPINYKTAVFILIYGLSLVTNHFYRAVLILHNLKGPQTCIFKTQLDQVSYELHFSRNNQVDHFSILFKWFCSLRRPLKSANKSFLPSNYVKDYSKNIYYLYIFKSFASNNIWEQASHLLCWFLYDHAVFKFRITSSPKQAQSPDWKVRSMRWILKVPYKVTWDSWYTFI